MGATFPYNSRSFTGQLHLKILVTGGAGFIGSAVVRNLMAATDWQMVNLDALTYAGNLQSLTSVWDNPRHKFVRGDIADSQLMRSLLADERPDFVMHLAAESHVDRSISGSAAFIQTNIVGTHRLLEEVLSYWRMLGSERQNRFRFHHISTDEVYGSLGAEGQFHEDTPYRPNSPYSASKAASDHLVRAWHHTYGLPTIVTNCSNNYGPFQFPEKLIPLMIVRALEEKPLPVYGKGENVRDWLHVEDHAAALLVALLHGRPGETYNIGGNSERRNIDVVRSVCALLDKHASRKSGARHEDLLEFVTDRPGHDARYAVNCVKMQKELDWRPREDFETGLAKTVRWYLENKSWWQNILSGEYRKNLSAPRQFEGMDL